MTKEQLTEQLAAAGIKKGSIVLLHSSLASIGKVEGGADAVIDAFLDAVGPEGTFMVPVFGALGVITEVLKKRPNAKVSPCPVGTLAGIGPAVDELFKNHWVPESPHALDTPFYRMQEKGALICLLGVDQDRNTSLHGIEALLKLPYLGQVTNTFTTPDGQEITKTWKHYPGPHRDFIGLDRRFLNNGVMTVHRLGNAQLRVLDSKKMWECCIEWGKADPAFVLCNNPNCPACVRQRADIFAARIAEQETFKLSISSRLAGRYVPEMVENIKAGGIKWVELDCIQGQVAANMPITALKAAVDEFAAAGISVSALRLPAAPDNAADILEKMNATGIKTVIMPASASVDCVKIFKDGGIEVLFCNLGMTGENSRIAVEKAGVKACFNPANFAQCGQNPFTVYRKSRFIKTTAQLDINDATRDGKITRLAYGEGEIKEIASILRCQNFTGFMTIGGGVIYPASAKDAVADFTNLLDTI